MFHNPTSRVRRRFSHYGRIRLALISPLLTSGWDERRTKVARALRLQVA